jgi:hypothetical protein
MVRARVVPWPAAAGAAPHSLVPRHANATHGVEVDGETVLYDARRGGLFLLNWSAGAVWRAIDGRTTVAELASRPAARFGTDEDTTGRDVDALLSLLGDAGLVVAVRPSG